MFKALLMRSASVLPGTGGAGSGLCETIIRPEPCPEARRRKSIRENLEATQLVSMRLNYDTIGINGV